MLLAIYVMVRKHLCTFSSNIHLVCWGALTNFPYKLRLKFFIHCTPWVGKGGDNIVVI